MRDERIKCLNCAKTFRTQNGLAWHQAHIHDWKNYKRHFENQIIELEDQLAKANGQAHFWQEQATQNRLLLERSTKEIKAMIVEATNKR